MSNRVTSNILNNLLVEHLIPITNEIHINEIITNNNHSTSTSTSTSSPYTPGIAISSHTYQLTYQQLEPFASVPIINITKKEISLPRQPHYVFHKRIVTQKQREENAQKKAEGEWVELSRLRDTPYCLTLGEKGVFLEFEKKELEEMKAGNCCERMVLNFLKLLEVKGLLGDRTLLYPLSFMGVLLEGWEGEEELGAVGRVVSRNLGRVGAMVPTGLSKCHNIVMVYSREGHYCAVLGVDLQGKDPLLVYCDTGRRMQKEVIEAVRCYLQAEFNSKKGRNRLDPGRMRAVQLMLPRQTRKADSPFCMLLSLQGLLEENGRELTELVHPEKRVKLHLYPQSVLFSLRRRYLGLLVAMTRRESARERRELLGEFWEEEKRLRQEAVGEGEYEVVDGRQLLRYYLLHGVRQTSKLQTETGYDIQLDFHLSPHCNHHD